MTGPTLTRRQVAVSRGTLYAQALAGRADVQLEYVDGRRTRLAVERWLSLRPGDEGLLGRCAAPVLDVGCGPGRLVTELAARGLVALGIDIAPAAVARTVRSGGSVLCRDVFARVPAAGRWRSVLLADGNIGIGGDPVALLARVRALLRPAGRVLVELDPVARGVRRTALRLRAGGVCGCWFPWAQVGRDALPAVAAAAGLVVAEGWTEAGRCMAALERT